MDPDQIKSKQLIFYSALDVIPVAEDEIAINKRLANEKGSAPEEQAAGGRKKSDNTLRKVSGEDKNAEDKDRNCLQVDYQLEGFEVAY